MSLVAMCHSCMFSLDRARVAQVSSQVTIREQYNQLDWLAVVIRRVKLVMVDAAWTCSGLGDWELLVVPNIRFVVFSCGVRRANKGWVTQLRSVASLSLCSIYFLFSRVSGELEETSPMASTVTLGNTVIKYTLALKGRKCTHEYARENCFFFECLFALYDETVTRPHCSVWFHCCALRCDS